MSEAERVTVTLKGGVADVRLNRPEKINALDLPMFEGLRSAAQRVAADPSVRAVVLSGEGRGFCAGLDLESITSMRDGAGGTNRLAERAEASIANLAQQAAYLWTVLEVPVIAAVHGVALGGGAQIALAADLRIVGPDARISVLEIRWGLVPDMTGTAVLPRLVGLDVAKELTWTGRMVEGEEAVRIGLATRTAADPRAEALALATEIAGRNPHAVRAAKRLLEQSGRVPLAQQLLDESVEMGRLIGSPNQTEAVQAWFEKREPVFSDPG
ncbi:MAG: crotonase/enoyl-CoA hydratase family protein [Actinomycetota bacterium]|nr:crotonase/enoyl-CoA hydratase family protein [Actinomycetota bacterium]